MLSEKKRQELIDYAKEQHQFWSTPDTLMGQLLDIALASLQEPVTYEPDMQQLTPEHIEVIRKASPASSLPDENFTNELFPAQDGWIEWGGGDCPVSSETEVEVRMRDGYVGIAPADTFRWKLAVRDQFPAADIIAYRVIGSEE